MVDTTSAPSWPHSKPDNISSNNNNNNNNNKNRLQDKNLKEMSDDGLCLTMHQPYASLLVAGIKIHEGRTWYSAHRGRLWIHAASRVTTDDEIKELENFYKTIYGSKLYWDWICQSERIA